MPKEYLKEKRALVKKGVPVKKAKKVAAIHYNKKHPDNPVTKNYEAKVKARKKKKAKGKKKATFQGQMQKANSILYGKK